MGFGTSHKLNTFNYKTRGFTNSNGRLKFSTLESDWYIDQVNLPDEIEGNNRPTAPQIDQGKFYVCSVYLEECSTQLYFKRKVPVNPNILLFQIVPKFL